MERNKIGKKAKVYLQVGISTFNMQKVTRGQRPTGSGEMSHGNNWWRAVPVEGPASAKSLRTEQAQPMKNRKESPVAAE